MLITIIMMKNTLSFISYTAISTLTLTNTLLIPSIVKAATFDLGDGVIAEVQTNTQQRLSILITGEVVNGDDQVKSFPFNGPWTGNLLIGLLPKGNILRTTDIVQVSGDITHVDGPHLNDGLADPFFFAVRLDGGGLVEDTLGNLIAIPEDLPAGDEESVIHRHIPNDHKDSYTAKFTNVILDDLQDPSEVTAWTFKITGVHTPEPSSTIGILALGIIAGAATLKSKLKSANSTEKETTKIN